MKLSKAQIEDAFNRAYEEYEEGGQWAVYDAVSNGEIPCDKWAHCIPCDRKSPILDNACLVCATNHEEVQDAGE